MPVSFAQDNTFVKVLAALYSLDDFSKNKIDTLYTELSLRGDADVDIFEEACTEATNILSTRSPAPVDDSASPSYTAMGPLYWDGEETTVYQ